MYQVKINREIGEVKTQAIYEENGVETSPVVMKTEQEISDEEQALKDAKASEVQAKVDTYEAAKAYQLANGGAGPVADFETMKICNEYNGQFEVVFK